MASVEFAPNQAKTEAITAHVLWVTVGLSCEGDSVAMTSAVNPSLEDIITGAIPGMPKVVIHNQVIAYEVGMDFIQPWFDAQEGKLVAIVAPEAAAAALEALRRAPGGEQAAEIGEVKTEPPGMVLMETAFGGRRVMDMLVGDPLPRIC